MLIVTLIILGILRICISAPMSPGSLFLIGYAASFILAGILHNKIPDMACGLVYLFLIPTMYQILIIFSFFNFNDISWGTREADNKSLSKDPINDFFQKILEQPAMGWLCKCFKTKKPETEEEKHEREMKKEKEKEEEELKKDPKIKKYEEHIALLTKTRLANEKLSKEEREKRDRLKELQIDRLKEKREQEITWLAYLTHYGLDFMRQRLESGIVYTGINEAEILNELTKVKYNVLWCVASANLIFYTLIVALSSMQDFNVLGTTVNAFSLFLLMVFGFVQFIQTICMISDGVKSWARRISYI